MNRYFWPILALLSIAGAAQQPTPPQLSTADKVAIQDFEKAKQDARKQFEDAQQGELTVLREWGTAHPGWHIDQTTFAITADPKPTKPEAKPEAPNKP